MKLSSQSINGLKVMYFLALTDFEKYISVSTISLNTSVSEKYLEKILRCLKKANLIVSSKGTDGGYKLINSPQVITCGQILRALENLSFKSESQNKEANFVFEKMFISINSTLDNITLQDIIEENKGR